MLGRRSNMGKLSVINEFLKPSLRNLEMSYTGKHDKLKFKMIWETQQKPIIWGWFIEPIQIVILGIVCYRVYHITDIGRFGTLPGTNVSRATVSGIN